MSSSQAYLGAFETTDAVKVVVNKEMIEDAFSAMEMTEIVITKNQWEKIWKAIYESDLVSDFIEGVIELAEDIVEGKN